MRWLMAPLLIGLLLTPNCQTHQAHCEPKQTVWFCSDRAADGSCRRVSPWIEELCHTLH